MKTPMISQMFCAGAIALTMAGAVHAQDASTPAATPKSAAEGKEASLSDAEQKYLQQVVKANLGEIATAYFAIEKSASNYVKDYSKDLIDTHTKTMKDLMELAAKHNAVLTLQPDLSNMEKLKSVGGGEFDKEYAAAAQRLNQEAVDQLNSLMGQLTASDVKDFAKADLKDDQKHLKDAQELASKLTKE